MFHPCGMFRVGRATLVAGMLLAGSVTATSATAQSTYYWDANGTTAGFGTASGTWGSSSFFSTNASGTVATSNLTTTTSDSLNFGAGSLGLAAGTIAVNGSQSIGSLVFGSVSGAITLSGGTISLADVGSMQVNNSAVTIGSVLGGAATRFTKSGTGGLTLTANNTYSGATSVVGLLMSATSAPGNVAGTGGPLRISGAAGRLANTSALTVTGATLINGDDTAANNSGITDRIASGITLTLGGVSGGGIYRQMAPAVGGTASQSFAALTVRRGLSSISGSGATGSNLLTFTGDAATAYARSVGSLVDIVPDAGFSVSFTNLPSQTAGTGANRILAGATINTNDFVGFSGSGPYVTGTASYTNLSSGTWATAGGNLRMNGGVTATLASGTAANSILFSGSTASTLNLSGVNVIGSGMVMVSSTTKSSTLSGGVITSGYTNSDGANELILTNRWAQDPRGAFGLLVSSTIADNGATPLSLTLGGVGGTYGATTNAGGGIRLNANNTFTGTTTINGAAVYVGNDAAFGAVPATPQVNIRVTAAGGYLAFTATGTLAANRTIQLENAWLGLQPAGSTFASKITGTGGLFGGPANTPTNIVVTGTNDFVGYMETGSLFWRADDGVGLSPNASLRFTANNGSPGAGVISTSGTFVRPLGGGAGQVQWGGSIVGGPYQSGGFSAVGGPLTVALGGTASPNVFTWGASSVNSASALYLQNTDATQPLTWVNPLDLANAIRIVAVSSTTQATLAEMTGAISGTGASSAFQKTGAGVLRLSSTASTYSGSTSLAAGTLEFVSLANTGSPSSL
ncbi:MAG: autotransporter-associated beta strand repeat-containing protein, partial [Pirellulales bacterium]